MIPSQVLREISKLQWRDPLDRTCREDVNRTIFEQFTEAASFEPEKLPDARERCLSCDLELVARKVRELRGEVDQQALECQTLIGRRNCACRRLPRPAERHRVGHLQPLPRKKCGTN